jgi:hypothetical protein
MKNSVCALIAGLVFTSFNPIPAAANESTADVKSKEATSAELEAKFKQTMTNAVMRGRYTTVEGGELSEEKADEYSIVKVSKLAGEAWIISAKIKYKEKEIVAPIPVFVKWAGDTPVISLTNIPIPGSGVFSARVMIYEGTYAGTWSGGGVAGLLSGVILPAAKPKAASPE